MNNANHISIKKPFFSVVSFTSISWLILIFFTSYYCYLYGIVYAKQDDFMCYFKWALWSWCVWLILIPIVFKKVEKQSQKEASNTFLTQLYAVIKLGAALCTIALLIQVVGTWLVGDNVIQDIYYYFPTNIKIFIMTSLMAFIIVNKNNLHKQNRSGHLHENMSCLNNNNQNISIDINNIDWLTTYGNYVQIYCDSHIYLKRVTMKEIELKLNNQQFIRIHRSHMINKNIIEEIHHKNGKNSLLTICGTLLPIGRSYKNNLTSQKTK